MWDYSDKVRDHYLHPRNVGEVENPDGFGEVGNISCGDALRLTFKLDDQKKISEVKFKTFGCGSAIASASMLTELCKGKTIEEIRQIKNKDITAALDGLPKEKMHCSVMGEEALEAAIKFYENGGVVSAAPEKDGKVVCHCFGITDKEIEKAVSENNLKTLEDVTNFTKAGGACGKCHKEIQSIIDTIIGAKKTTEPVAPTRMTTLQKIDKIRDVIATDIRPILAQDGGDCELVDVDGNDVYIAFKGHCKGCAHSNLTLISVVEKKLREKISDKINVKLS